MRLIYRVEETNNRYINTPFVMSTTSIDPVEQGAAEAGPPAVPTSSTTVELPDPSTYKVYRPPSVLGSASFKGQWEVRALMQLH